MAQLEDNIDQLKIKLRCSIDASRPGHIEELSTCALEVIEAVLACGQSIERPKHYADYVILHRWMPQLKSYAVLLRNSVYNLLEGHELLQADIVSDLAYADLQKTSNRTISSACDELLGHLQVTTSSATAKELARWQLEQSPWPSYADQFEQLHNQLIEREQNHKSVIENAESMLLLRSRVIDAADAVTKRVESIMNILNAAQNVLLDADNRSIETITHKLRELEEDAISSDDLSMLSSEIDPLYLKFSNSFQQLSTIPGSAMIAISEVNLQNRVQRWLESEVITYLHEASTLVQLYQSDTLRALANARNRVQVAEPETDRSLEDQLTPVVQSISKERSRLEQDREMVAQMIGRARHSLNEHFTLSKLLREREDFLVRVSDFVPNNVDQASERVRDQVTRWIKKPLEILRQLNQNTQLDISMTVAERIVQFLRFYSVNHSLSPYTSIFRIKGFIGDSFITGRNSELARIESAIEDWRSGYRGTLCIKGERYAGKSLLGELIATRYFTDNVIRLKPGEPFLLNGRRIEGSYDLKRILEEIRKHTITRRFLIWIDDLEQWRDRETSVLQNCQNLSRHMDQFNSRFFYAVSISNHFWTKLEQTIQIRRVFQTVLSLPAMSSAEIWEAIRIRHSATHHQALRTQNEEPMSMEKLRDQGYKIARLAKGNIGDALLYWAGCAAEVNDDTVILKTPDIQDIPEFLELDTAIVLHTIVEHRTINEYALRQLFGPAFSDRYIHILRRLLSVGVLHRHANGSLELTDIVSNKIGRLLEKYYPIDYSG